MRLAYFLIAFFTCSISFSQSLYKNLVPKSNWDNDSLPVYVHGAYNDVWGYTDYNGNEYAILGTIGGTYFINVTDPLHPQEVAFFPGKDSIGVNRDYATYSHYVYAVCDQGNSSLQIFDVSGLPSTITKVYDSQALVKTCHTIYVDKQRLYLCGSKNSSGVAQTLVVASLEDPANPETISILSTPNFSYVHDAFIRNDTAYLSCAGSGLFIYDYRDSLQPKLLQTFTSYPQQGYNHTNWVSDDGKILVFADETHGSGLKVYDISDFDNPVLKNILRSNRLAVADSLGSSGSIPHNPVLVKNKLFVSYYHEGVVVFDLTEPDKPFIDGYYDTDPLSMDYSGFSGCWGVYPFFQSENIIASDMKNGLFVLDANSLLNSPTQFSSTEMETYSFPNPSNDVFYFNANLKHAGSLSYSVNDISGKLFTQQIISNLPSGNSVIEVLVSSLPSGSYILSVKTSESTSHSKVTIIK